MTTGYIPDFPMPYAHAVSEEIYAHIFDVTLADWNSSALLDLLCEFSLISDRPWYAGLRPGALIQGVYTEILARVVDVRSDYTIDIEFVPPAGMHFSQYACVRSTIYRAGLDAFKLYA